MKSSRTCCFMLAVILIPTLLLAGGNAFFQELQAKLEQDFQTIRDERILLYDIYLLNRFLMYWPQIENTGLYLTQLEQNPELSPLLRAEAAYQKLLYSFQRGHVDEAEKLKRKLGFLTEWSLIGPFPNENKTGFAEAYPPETGLPFDASCMGLQRQVTWRPIASTSSKPFIYFGTYLYPADDYVAYAVTFVKTDAPEEAVLRLGVKGAFKVWVNDREAFSIEDDNASRFDQYAAGLYLRKGMNKILLKCCVNQGGGNFCARLTTPDGEALQDLIVTATAEKESYQSASQEDKATFSDFLDLSALFKENTESETVKPEDYRLYGAFLLQKKNFDSQASLDTEVLKKAILLDPGDPWTYFYLSKTRRDLNKQRADLEKALEARPDFTPAALALAKNRKQRGYLYRALEILENNLKIREDAPVVQLRRELYISESTGMPDVLNRLEKLGDRLEDFPLYHRTLSTVYQNYNMKQKAIGAIEHYLTFFPFNREMNLDLVDLLFGRDRAFDRCQELLDTLIQVYPNDLFLRFEKISLLESRFMLPEVEQELTELLDLNPAHPSLLATAGHTQHRMGNSEEGLNLFLSALDIKPQENFLQDYVEFLNPEAHPYEKDYVQDVKNAIEAFKQGENPDPLAGAVYLIDNEVEKVYPSGLSSSFSQVVIKINNRQGKEELKFFTIPFHAGRQRLDIQEAQVIKPDGSGIRASISTTDYLSDSSARLYYDLRAKRVFFPDLEPGDFIDLQYKISDVGQKNIYGEYFGAARYFGGDDPRLLSEYTLLVPDKRSIYFKMYNSEIKPQEEDKDGFRSYRWRFENLSSFEREPNMPGPSEIFPFLLVSTYSSWDEMAHWYHNLVKDQLDLTPELKQLAIDLTSHCRDDFEKVLQIYDYIISNIHYVGLEFGIHSYKPYRVEKIHTRKYGDCKDKASLMAALLREVGIEAELVLLRTRNLGQISWDIPTLSLFNHVICYVPAFDLFLDGTAEFNAAGELPALDQNTLVALLDQEGDIRLQQSPLLPASENHESKEIEIFIEKEGSARLVLNAEIQGDSCPSFRRYFQNESKRITSFEKLFRKWYPASRVEKVEFKGLDPTESGCGYRAECRVDQFARLADGAFLIKGALTDTGLVGDYASLSSRRHDLVIPAPFSKTTKIVYHFPEGSAISNLPEPLSLQTPFGSFDFSTEQRDERTIIVHSRLSVDVARVPAGEYELFRDFCLKIDQKLSETTTYRMQ